MKIQSRKSEPAPVKIRTFEDTKKIGAFLVSSYKPLSIPDREMFLKGYFQALKDEGILEEFTIVPNSLVTFSYVGSAFVWAFRLDMM